MKKFFALALVLILALSSVGAFAAAPAELLGTWYVGEVQIAKSIYLLVGDCHVEFKRDSTAILVLNGESKEYTWKATESGAELRDAENDGVYFRLENDQLKVSMKDFTRADSDYLSYVFSREKPEVFTIPAVITADQEESFFGNWKVAFTVASRGVKNAKEEDASKNFKVEFAQITLTDGENVSYALTDFADGKLKCKASDLHIGNGVVIVELAENGYARITLEGVPEEQFNYYLTKVDSAAEGE